jgi:iron(III) transport system substrate-binding protein
VRARQRAGSALLLAAGLVLSACAGTGGGSNSAASSSASSSAAASSATGAITLYTCINDDAIQPIIQGFQAAHPGDRVDLFRAPTGQLNARVAADVRSGGLKADVIWACDPLTMAAFVRQRLVGGWTPAAASAVPARYRTEDYVAAVLLYVVAVRHSGEPAPKTWADLAGPAYGGAVAVPDPAVAASALGALGWFAAQRGYGMRFYRDLRDAGAVQVSTPDDVTTGVAQGRYEAGITIASSAYPAKAQGSPIDVTWPDPGAIAVYEPVALSRTSQHRAVAQDFISFLFGSRAQRALSAAGGYPVVPGVRAPTQPSDAPVVEPDWSAIASSRDRILAQYQQVFGG